MKIALIAHDNKKELIEAFCTAYKFILEKHELVASRGTATILEENVGLVVQNFAQGELGEQQIAARVAYNEIDMVIFFRDFNRVSNVAESAKADSLRDVCDANNIPFATNIATAEVLILGLEHGYLAWREIVNPS